MPSKIKKTILDIPNYYLIPIIIFVGFGLAYSSISILTSFSNFEKTGPIGDTIGGLTAPVFSLIASILVFISFKEQYKANQLQKTALEQEINRSNSNNEYNQIIDLINEIKNEINSLNFYYDAHDGVLEGHTYKGFRAIENLDKSVFDIEQGKYKELFWDDLILSLNLIVFTINKIDCYEYKKEEQQVLKIKFYTFLKKISSDIFSYSIRLQKIQIPYEQKHFLLFINYEAAITHFTIVTQKEVLNNTDIITTKFRYNPS